MNDFRTFVEKKRGWWVEENAKVPCIVSKDGQTVVFLRKDVETLMDEKYPHALARTWWFNETRDREIAETEDDRIYANPQVLWGHFL